MVVSGQVQSVLDFGPVVKPLALPWRRKEER